MAASAKSATGEPPSKDKEKDEIIVILRSQNTSSIPERRLVLTPSCPAISIGRSSKDHSKGFIPANDNAWLDNPVMSREHAQLLAKFDENPCAVYLKDVNSFHGTYITTSDGYNQGRQLLRNELVKLAHGDTIQFGIEIFRSNKTYPPCFVNFLTEGMTQKADPHRSFTVPDDVDEDEENDEHDDCENEDDLTITAVHTRSDTIDLTNTWSPPAAPRYLTGAKLSSSSAVNDNTRSNVVDLTSDVATCPSDAEPCTIDQATPRPCASVLSSPAPSGSSLVEGHPSPRGPIRLSYTSDGSIVYEPLFYDSDLSDEDLSSSPDDHDSDSDSDIDIEASSMVTEEIPEVSDADEPSQTHDDTSSEMDLEIEEHLSEDYVEDFEQRNSCFDESNGSYSSGEEDDEPDVTIEPPNAKPSTEAQPPSAQETIQYETGPTDSCPPAPVWLAHNPSHLRDPSPSDAALFKRRPLLDTIPNDTRAQELGEKSGKFEFFAAREKNRATINQNDSTAQIAANAQTPSNDREISSGINSGGDKGPIATVASSVSRSVSPSLSCMPAIMAITEGIEDNSEAPDTSSIKLGDNDTHQYSAWSASGDQFINNPPNESSPACQGAISRLPAELDMTSAYTFQQSKLATAAEAVCKTRRLPIEDLLAQDPNQCSIPVQPIPETPMLENSLMSCASTPIKRSYEEAFHQTKHDTASKCANRAIARCSPRISEAKDQGLPFRDSVADVTGMERTISLMNMKAKGHDTPKHEPTVIIVRSEAPRAAKRMRLATTAAQVVACVALGSAATFSYLVNTAPVL